jgi:hypothetical protein
MGLRKGGIEIGDLVVTFEAGRLRHPISFKELSAASGKLSGA